MKAHFPSRRGLMKLLSWLLVASSRLGSLPLSTYVYMVLIILQTVCASLPSQMSALEDCSTLWQLRRTHPFNLGSNFRRGGYFCYEWASQTSIREFLLFQVATQVAEGKLEAGACVVRPPGLHAGANTRRGFSIFNHVAAAVKTMVSYASRR